MLDPTRLKKYYTTTLFTAVLRPSTVITLLFSIHSGPQIRVTCAHFSDYANLMRLDHTSKVARYSLSSNVQGKKIRDRQFKVRVRLAQVQVSLKCEVQEPNVTLICPILLKLRLSCLTLPQHHINMSSEHD